MNSTPTKETPIMLSIPYWHVTYSNFKTGARVETADMNEQDAREMVAAINALGGDADLVYIGRR